MIHKLLRGFAPVAALVLGVMASGCDGMTISIGDQEGVPLSELDLAGAIPTDVVLASSDSVVITEGSELSIDVEGDADVVEAMRFTLNEDTLGILRERNFDSDGRVATVRVTMPSPQSLVLAGSGNIATQSMADNADATIAGSGRIDIANLEVRSLDLNIMGNGRVSAAGSVSKLDLNIAGSGAAELDELTVDNADVTIAGSGSGAFASDGKVEAQIMGSGDVTVFGRATCEVSSMGSGSVTCKPATPDSETGSAAE